MLDSRFVAFVGFAALLVLSPGATMVVVADAAIEAGRRAAMWTVAGIGSANATLALVFAFGVSAIVRHVPVVLNVISIAGAAYLAWLGVRALVRARREPPVPMAAHGPADRARIGPDVLRVRQTSPAARFGRGLITNFANPPVVFFYAVVVPQFIAPHEPFLTRYLLLGGTHVAMSVVWQGAVGISVGTFADRMANPAVRRWMDIATGIALVAFAVKILV